MKKLKKTLLCLVFFIMSNYSLFGAQRVFIPFRMLSTLHMVPKMNNCSVEQKRNKSSTFNDSKKNCCSLPERSGVLTLSTNEQNQEDSLEKYTHLLTLCEQLLKVKTGLDDINQKSAQQKNIFRPQNQKPDSSHVGLLNNALLPSVQKLESRLYKQSGDVVIDSDSNKKDGSKSKILSKECMLINRLFTLLPEYHSNSITRIMLGNTQPKKSSPVWNDLLSAIEQINQEASREGDHPTIDLNYFRGIYSLAKDKLGKTSNNLSDSLLQTKDGMYSMTKKDQEVLNRLFMLLPKYHSNSITRILLGKTEPNKRSPVWNDLLSAIEQIKQEEGKEGWNAQTINLNYFRKLQWLSVRITGKGGSREFKGKEEQ